METKDSNHLLRLADKAIIAKGNRQFVYEHPDVPGTLLKVPQPDTMDANANLLTDTWFDRIFRRSTAFKGFLREFHESFELMARHQTDGVDLPVCEVRGAILTDLGLALVYERISDPDGQLSPSLHLLASTGRLTQQHVDDLERHFELLVTENVIISNGNPGNVVYQTRPDGTGRWVWIDSFGCKQTIPVRRWSRRLNARKLERVRLKFLGIAHASLPQNNSN
ncbi:YrbL family protein [Ruegeria halocynthiae]|uniref:YrbL family protein n=1 Tax=Ruegeria halocynthiae TaxID=985054 RepID=UPI00055BCB79|nr:YrbL family protein [Ruegeria halocynthiae]